MKKAKEIEADFRKDFEALLKKHNAEIEITDECTEAGDVTFEIPMKSLGLEYDIYLKYKKDICSDFISNFMGELLVRENLNQFAKILTGISHESYPSLVNRFEHRKFGMDVIKGKFSFVFHISLLEDILLEDLRRKVK